MAETAASTPRPRAPDPPGAGAPEGKITAQGLAALQESEPRDRAESDELSPVLALAVGLVNGQKSPERHQRHEERVDVVRRNPAAGEVEEEPVGGVEGGPEERGALSYEPSPAPATARMESVNTRTPGSRAANSETPRAYQIISDVYQRSDRRRAWPQQEPRRVPLLAARDDRVSRVFVADLPERVLQSRAVRGPGGPRPGLGTPSQRARPGHQGGPSDRLRGDPDAHHADRPALDRQAVRALVTARARGRRRPRRGRGGPDLPARSAIARTCLGERGGARDPTGSAPWRARARRVPGPVARHRCPARPAAAIVPPLRARPGRATLSGRRRRAPNQKPAGGTPTSSRVSERHRPAARLMRFLCWRVDHQSWSGVAAARGTGGSTGSDRGASDRRGACGGQGRPRRGGCDRP